MIGRRLLKLCLIAVLVGAACGIPEDREVRAISVDDLPAELVPEPTPTEAPQVVTVPATIYLLDVDDNLQAVEVDIDAPGAAIDLIVGLIRGLPREEAEQAGLRTAIPPESVVLSAELSGAPDADSRIMTIDFEQEGLILLEEPDEQRAALAQLVWTATEVEDVDRVLIQADGEFRSILTDTGATAETLQTVNRGNYESFGPAFIDPETE